MTVWPPTLTLEHIPVGPAECQTGRRCGCSQHAEETPRKGENVQNRGGCAWNTEEASAACVSLGRNTGNCYFWGLSVWLIRDGRAWKRLFLGRGRVPQPCIAVYCWHLALFSDMQHSPSSGYVPDRPQGLWQVRKDSKIGNPLISMELFPKVPFSTQTPPT